MKRYLIFAILAMGNFAQAEESLTDFVIRHCLVDESKGIENCYTEVVENNESQAVYVTQEVADYYWWKPELSETLDWTLESDDFISTLEVTETWFYFYDHESQLKKSLSPGFTLLSADCNNKQCASAVIGGAMEGALNGGAAGTAAGAVVGGAKGAVGGLVVGGVVGGVAGGMKHYGSTPACNCGGGDSESRVGRIRGSGHGMRGIIYNRTDYTD